MLPMIVKIIGILIIVMSVVYIIKPGVPRGLIRFFIKGNWMYFAGVIRLVLAIIFLLAARETNNPKVIGAFGVLMLISAMMIFSLGKVKINNFMLWWEKQSDTALRIISLVALAIGSAIVYFA